MAKRVQDVRPPRKPDAEKWLRENVTEQKKRYAAIVREMDGIEKERQRWYAEFLHIVSTRGWNVNGDQRMVVPVKDLPKRPKGRSKVVF
ncbi:MAG: hypothetical protein IT486_08165 [Gammaproteobacteria bacterium]|nr:hypothetical protein [Gammaproteobacteria bacterium]